MADVLARIVARKKVEVKERIGGKAIAAEPTSRSLIAALRAPGARFIMEVKPKSPSGHVARHEPQAALAAYRPIADAISVLTDGEDFGGSLALLEAIRKGFDGPILAKDFIVDAAQVREARAHGADAVLCMLSVLDDGGARRVMEEAQALSMDVLVEVHDEEEMERALALEARLIGINNRDLKTLTTDLAVTERLVAMAPAEVTLISESGIAGRADVMRLADKVDGFLVGSHLMAADDIALAARELVHGAVKICGLTNGVDVLMAAALGASHAGFIMVPDTPRHVAQEEAARLASLAARMGMKTVGVFRGQAIEEMAAIANSLKFDVVQVHDREAAMDLAALRALLKGAPDIWDAGSVRAEEIVRADRRLFDNQDGGTGQVFDWSRLPEGEIRDRAFLAGGIAPGNARAAQAIGTYGLDIGSGVEERPGRKSREKMEQLFAALRAPARGDNR
ncbi:bifunctional indole-3-glycerol-phosphate synthase TrpC/phosphoribosylanthranilate isomerase TrpF [Sphingomicrobium flavum]|uniref:bifunctional indole-3-glycerol-phosphate synthase TrpC/phosphoribosylanthranilate isomerase TrpF n=1 Tax=Sphingomicrobium flavum TaxID=1229164 RepID=UPI0021ADF8A5|nr:bifunctional indole-3-glycerol-phosphate synthase TrpC/phosphoribosylanthranilate isomerase TrpF [Sphingomicrobium flavum]